MFSRISPPSLKSFLENGFYWKIVLWEGVNPFLILLTPASRKVFMTHKSDLAASAVRKRVLSKLKQSGIDISSLKRLTDKIHLFSNELNSSHPQVVEKAMRKLLGFRIELERKLDTLTTERDSERRTGKILLDRVEELGAERDLFDGQAKKASTQAKTLRLKLAEVRLRDEEKQVVTANPTSSPDELYAKALETIKRQGALLEKLTAMAEEQENRLKAVILAESSTKQEIQALRVEVLNLQRKFAELQVENTGLQGITKAREEELLNLRRQLEGDSNN